MILAYQFDSLNSEGQTKLLDFELMPAKIPNYLGHEKMIPSLNLISVLYAI